MEEDQANDESQVVLPTDSLAVGEMIYQDLDPLDSRKVALNLFEVYCHEMLSTKYIARRAFLLKEMKVSLLFDKLQTTTKWSYKKISSTDCIYLFLPILTSILLRGLLAVSLIMASYITISLWQTLLHAYVAVMPT